MSNLTATATFLCNEFEIIVLKLLPHRPVANELTTTLLNTPNAIHPKKHIHGLRFVVRCFGHALTDFTHIFQDYSFGACNYVIMKIMTS